MVKPVELRRRAAEDINAAADHYLREGGSVLAGRFIDALEQAIEHLERHPLTGSLHYSYELDIPELRTWPVAAFPFLIFYVDSSDHVDVWRLLHGHRDIALSLRH